MPNINFNPYDRIHDLPEAQLKRKAEHCAKLFMDIAEHGPDADDNEWFVVMVMRAIARGQLTLRQL